MCEHYPLDPALLRKLKSIQRFPVNLRHSLVVGNVISRSITWMKVDFSRRWLEGPELSPISAVLLKHILLIRGSGENLSEKVPASQRENIF